MSDSRTKESSTLDNAAIKATLKASQEQYPPFGQIIDALLFTMSDGRLDVFFPHARFAAFFRAKWKNAFEKLARAALGADIDIIYADANTRTPKDTFIEPTASVDPFANFLSNARNSLAVAAAKSLGYGLSHQKWIFFVLCGQSGVGKTALLTAIKNALKTRLGQNAVVHTSAPYFLPCENPQIFWKNSHALLLDDCQITSSTDIAAYLDAGTAANGQRGAVLAFTGKPGDIEHFDQRLAMRLRSAALFELCHADLSMRMAYAEKHTLPVALNRQQLLAMARSAPTIPALAGILQKLEIYVNVSGDSLSPDELAKMTLPEARQQTGWQRIVALVAAKTRQSEIDLMGSRRKHDLVLARMVAMYLCHKQLGLSYSEIGRIFGGRDHSTVMYGIKKIQELRQVDKLMHNLLTELEKTG